MARQAGQADTGQGNRLWTADFVLNLLTAHFMFAGYTAMLTVIPPYVLHLHGTTWHIGIIVGAFGIVGLLIRPVGGQWIYAFGPKRVAVAGTAIVALGSVAYIFALGPWWLVPMRMFQGVGLALGPVATSTIVANLAPANRRAEAMAYMGNAINASFLYSPFVASYILTYVGENSYGFTYAFVFSAAAALLGTLFAARISARRIGFEQGQAGAAATSASGDKPPLVSRAAMFPTLVFLTYTFTTAPINTFLPLLASQGNLGNPGLFYTVFSVTAMGAMAAAGPIADRLGRPTVIVPGAVVGGDGDVCAEWGVFSGDVPERGVFRGARVWAAAAGDTGVHGGSGAAAGAERGDGDAAAGVGYWGQRGVVCGGAAGYAVWGGECVRDDGDRCAGWGGGVCGGECERWRAGSEGAGGGLDAVCEWGGPLYFFRKK